jgi:F-type H+-transporting ATPase subunit delta
MHESTIARNYAQALLTLAVRANDVDAYRALIDALASAVREQVVFRRFLEAPQVAESAKREVLRKALAESAPRPFALFVDKVVSNRRQMLLPAIAVEYASLVDEREGRVHATVTVARQPQAGEADELSRRLSEALGKSVVAHVMVNPDILGGIVVRVGDSVMDGSVRRRLGALRAALVSAQP